MKNSECVVHLSTKHGSTQTFEKDAEGGWKQTSSRGIVRRCTAEQFLSHLLPALCFGHVAVKVERKARQ